MAHDATFADFMRRIRAGDARAAEDLVRQFEPAVRVAVRVRLHDPRLRRAFDSMDVCQSVLASFFVRVAAGQYDLERPQDLVRLLVGMARRKLAFKVRKERAGCRDNRRLVAAILDQVEDSRVKTGPLEEIAARELLGAFQQRLSDEERQLADRRSRGEGWSEIAAALGGTAQSRRKQLDRAVRRVSRQLGLEGDDDG
jgi:RNA polymerase sigma-70 factor (ECF subfamily)